MHQERKHRYVPRRSFFHLRQPLYGNHRSDHDEVWHVYQLGRFDRYWPNNRKRNLHGGGLPNYPTDEGAVQVSFTVEGCGPTVPTTKEQCKKGGWSNLGFPDQGTCVSAVNRQNRQ